MGYKAEASARVGVTAAPDGPNARDNLRRSVRRAPPPITVNRRRTDPLLAQRVR
jgi:hypothetical protein